MSCVYCGFQLKPDQIICPNCHQNSPVTILPPEERESFDGLTIEQVPNKAEYQYRNSQVNTGTPHIFIRQLSFRGNLFVKLLLGAIFLLIIFVALPLALLCISFAAIKLIAKTTTK